MAPDWQRPVVEIPQARDYCLKIRHLNIPVHWEQWYLLISDCHWDAPECYIRLLHHHLREAKRRNALIIDCGDFFEVISGQGDPRSTKGNLLEKHLKINYLDRLVEDGIEEFRPYLDNFVYMGTGNHEQAVTVRKETDITQRFVDAANTLRPGLPPIWRAGYTGWIRFQFETSNARMSYAMKIEHGTGGNSPVTKGTIQTARRASRTEGATFFVSGHIHEKWNIPLVVERLNSSTGQVELREVEHIQLGSYRQDFRTDGNATWAMMRQGAPKPVGGYWIRFHLPRRRNNHVEWEVQKARVDYPRLQQYLRKGKLPQENNA
jgi:hypothetical protein